MRILVVPGRALGPVELGMTRDKARAACRFLGSATDVRRWRDQPLVLSARDNAFQVYFDADDVVKEVEAFSRVGAVLRGINLLGDRWTAVVSEVSAVLGEDPVVAGRDTSFEWSSGLRLWRQIRDAEFFTSALVLDAGRDASEARGS